MLNCSRLRLQGTWGSIRNTGRNGRRTSRDDRPFDQHRIRGVRILWHEFRPQVSLTGFPPTRHPPDADWIDREVALRINV
jgi:hypothetical protein